MRTEEDKEYWEFPEYDPEPLRSVSNEAVRAFETRWCAERVRKAIAETTLPFVEERRRINELLCEISPFLNVEFNRTYSDILCARDLVKYVVSVPYVLESFPQFRSILIDKFQGVRSKIRIGKEYFDEFDVICASLPPYTDYVMRGQTEWDWEWREVNSLPLEWSMYSFR
jgi:hypothetical protein